MEEIWKDIDGYEGIYQISNLGRVKSLSRVVIRKNGAPNGVKEKFFKRKVHSTGYYIVGLTQSGKTKNVKLHRLIAKAFIPNPKNLTDVNHINYDRSDNRIENLEWTSHRENGVHGFRNTKKTSKYPGVSWNKHRSRWAAFIQVEGRQINLGGFLSEEEAHQSYLNAHNRFGIQNKYAA